MHTIKHTSKRPRSRESLRGFTLVELLVVIAVIALLLSILMPSLSKARYFAKRVVCVSNLRQLMVGMAMYADSNKDNYPWLPGGNAWSGWGTYGMAVTTDYGQTYQAVGLGLLIKHKYVGGDVKFYYCPGRNRSYWPASYIFDRDTGWVTDTDGVTFPRASCYSLRGLEDNDPKNWKATGPTRALAADMFLMYYLAVEPHKIGLNVGHSDGSASFVGGRKPFPGYSTSFFEQLEIWDRTDLKHHEIYRFLDTQ